MPAGTPLPIAEGRREGEVRCGEHALELGKRVGLPTKPEGVDGPGSRLADVVPPCVSPVAGVIEILTQHELREAPGNKISAYPPFLHAVQISEEQRSVNIKNKGSARAQTVADASQNVFRPAIAAFP